MSQQLRIVIYCLVLSLMVACGGGGTNGPERPLAKVGLTDTWLFYLGSGGRLMAVDPTVSDNAIKEIMVAGNSVSIQGPAWYRYIQVGRYVNQKHSDLHQRYLVFINADGAMYRVDAKTGSGTPQAIRMGSANYGEFCSTHVVPDYVSASESLLLFKHAGAGACSDANAPGWAAFSMQANQTTTQMNARKVISGIYNSSGKPVELLVKNSGALARSSLSFSAFEQVGASALALGTPQRYTRNLNGVILFATDKNTGNVMGYDMAAGALSRGGGALYGPLLAAPADRAQDETDVYFENGNTIYRVAKNGANVAAAVSSQVAAGITSVKQTQNYIVYQDALGALYRIAKTASSGTGVKVADDVEQYLVHGPWILFNTRRTTAPLTRIANIIREDGSGLSSLSGEATTPQLGAFWTEIERLPEHMDNINFSKGRVILAYESDAGAGFYRLPQGSIDLTDAQAMLTIPVASVDASYADIHEGNYALMIVTGNGAGVYIYDRGAGRTTRIDDGADGTADDPVALVSS